MRTCNGNLLTDTDVVTVSEGIASFTLTPSTTAVDVYEVTVTAAGAAGYLSEDRATLVISVNGQQVFDQSFDISASADISASPTIPLSKAGPNEIVATLSYQGNHLTQTATVSVAPATPQLTFPSWTTAFTQSGNATITTATGWSIDDVSFARDSGEFFPASMISAGVYELALANLDIGDNALTVRVQTSNLGHSQTHYFFDTVPGVAPVFDCNDSSKMSPTSTLIRNNSTETRTMLGYFGDPDGGHTVSFVITFDDDNGDTFVNPSTTLSYGRTSIETDLDVNRFRCNGTGCSNKNYDLDVFVDGVSLCSKPAYGIILDFN